MSIVQQKNTVSWWNCDETRSSMCWLYKRVVRHVECFVVYNPRTSKTLHVVTLFLSCRTQIWTILSQRLSHVKWFLCRWHFELNATRCVCLNFIVVVWSNTNDDLACRCVVWIVIESNANVISVNEIVELNKPNKQCECWTCQCVWDVSIVLVVSKSWMTFVFVRIGQSKDSSDHHRIQQTRTTK